MGKQYNVDETLHETGLISTDPKGARALTDHRSGGSPMGVYVFSFNRPLFLQNCLASLARHAAIAPVTVLDDDSRAGLIHPLKHQFPDVRFLTSAELRQGVKRDRHGGLYRNMNWAITDARSSQRRFAMFLQDDMQLVRSVTEDDMAAINAFFESNTESYVLSPCFLKGGNAARDTLDMRLDASGHAFLRMGGGAGRNQYFSDASIFSVQRTHLRHGTFAKSEAENEDRARLLGAQMGFMRRPFAMWMPFPTSYRHRRRTFGLWICDSISGAGCFPIQDMSQEEIHQLFSAQRGTLPIAEKYLTSPGAPQGRFWGLGGASNTSARGGWRRLVGGLVSRCSRI